MIDRLAIGRRGFLTASSAALAVPGLASLPHRAAAQETALPGYAAFKDAEAMIVHSENTIETRRDAFDAGAVTPAELLYVRNNVAPPDPSILDDPGAWTIEVAGVAEPRSFSVNDLKSIGLETVVMVLQCSGNGRAFFEHETSGTQWQTGAAGNVVWSGVPLAAVIERLGGPAEGARFITGTGGEVLPEGVDPLDLLVERSVPIEALDRILLAWEMNGAPIPLAHGGPLRMIVPGFTGVNNIKYLERIALTETESPARIQQARYRLQPIGVEGGPEYPSVWEMEAKSWITAPLAAAEPGIIQIVGIAFGGAGPLQRVEVSTDGGASWEEARLIGPDLGRYAWRTFVLARELVPGRYRLASRATDESGYVQPRDPAPNGSGYNHNGWDAHGVELVVG